MEEKKNTTAYENMMKDIKELEELVQRIYYISLFEVESESEKTVIEVAEEYNQKVNELKNRFLTKVYSSKNQIMFGDFDDIITQTNNLRAEIQEYLDKDEKENKMTRERYIRKTDEITKTSENKSTQELWDGVREIVEDWRNECKDHPNFEVLQYEINKTVSRAVLRILERQAKIDEKVDLEPVDKVCSRADLADTIKEKLIQMAKETKDPKKRAELLDTAKYLTEKRLSNPKVWEQLVGKDNIEIKDVQPKSIEISKPKKSEFKKRFFGQTIYTLGDIDEETGEWINVKEVYGKFPKNFSKRFRNRVLKIDIHGVKRIMHEDFQDGIKPMYSNLQEVIIGNEVDFIDQLLFEKYENLKKVKLGTGIAIIPYGCFKKSGIENIIMSENVVRIGDEAFCECKKLTKIDLNDGLKFIDRWAFEESGLKSVEIPDTVDFIEFGAYCRCDNLENVHIGKGLRYLPEYIFKGSMNLKTITIPKNIDDIGCRAFVRMPKFRKYTIRIWNKNNRRKKFWRYCFKAYSYSRFCTRYSQ